MRIEHFKTNNPFWVIVAEKCSICIGACDCISQSEMGLPETVSSENKSDYEKVVINIKIQNKVKTFELSEVSWRKFFIKQRKFRVKFGNEQWDIHYERKNKVKGYNKNRPSEKMIILKGNNFPHPYSLFSIDFGWWLPSSEGGPRPKGRFGFYTLFYDNNSLSHCEIGIYSGEDLSHLDLNISK
tara:strand:- start:481 stop:1032 length:552 start_codon:yes stop_codon:yes gene_type:complete